MKKVSIIGFKDFIKRFVTVFSSREFAFVYCLLGTVGQISHCYYLVYSVSSFTGVFKVIQAILLALFISSSLMYFVSIADSDDDPKEYKRIKRAINLFMYIEILMNMYYYCQHLIILSKPMRLFDFLFSLIISALIPITIKLYSNSIKAKAWIQEIESKYQPKNSTENDSIKKEVKDLITGEFEKIKDANDSLINKTIDEKMQTFKGRRDNNLDIDDVILKKNVESMVKNYIDNNPKIKK